MTADEINKLAEEAPTRDTIRTVIRYVLDGQGVSEGLIRNAVANVDGVLDMLAASPSAPAASSEDARSCILQEIEYASTHGWPSDSLRRLTQMAIAQRYAAAIAATPEAPI